MSGPSSSATTTTVWLTYYTKLHFFTRIRRFLKSKAAQKNKPRTKVMIDNKEVQIKVTMDGETEDDSLLLQRSVKKLHFGSWEEKELAAKEIGKLAKENVKTRKLMAELGVIPALVELVASEVTARRQNKALMVEAGIFSKLPKNEDVSEDLIMHDFAELILSLSSLAKTQFHLASSEVLPFLVGILESSSSVETKESCLGTLYNLSAVLENAGPLISNGVVQLSWA
ncbi:hypothetical protein GH714_003457 [Hevea brasiliensis]|uniref:Uncharacterized protein n=1 Tax=Hevea brasiliensis TaxID=3981 RepID=A0A6A6LV41_HEVBR|nr:hypothetical protein GH714_003457 [Hevea brasiliensis]